MADLYLFWVEPNEDKPHRCPGCHGIAMRAWDVTGRGYAPRTRMACPGNCGLMWRVGVRAKRVSMRRRQRNPILWRRSNG